MTDPIESMKDFLDSVKKKVNDELRKTAPNVVNSLDKSIDEGAKVLSDTLAVLDKKSRKEQLELLKSYQTFIDRQSELVKRRIRSLQQAG